MPERGGEYWMAEATRWRDLAVAWRDEARRLSGDLAHELPVEEEPEEEKSELVFESITPANLGGDCGWDIEVTETGGESRSWSGWVLDPTDPLSKAQKMFLANGMSEQGLFLRIEMQIDGKPKAHGWIPLR